MATMISHPAGKSEPGERPGRWPRRRQTKARKGRTQVADVDAELRVAAQVPGVQVVEVNVQQAQGLESFACSWFFSQQRMD